MSRNCNGPMFFLGATCLVVLYCLIVSTISVLIFHFCFVLSCVLVLRAFGLGSVNFFLTASGAGVFVFAIWFLSMGPEIYYQGGSDDLSYERYGAIFADVFAWSEWYRYDLVQEKVVGTRHNSIGYVYFVGLLVKLGDFLGGFDTLMPRLANVHLLAFLATYLQKLLPKLGVQKKAGYWASMLFCLMPGVTFIAAFTFRDVIIAGFYIIAFGLSLSFDSRAKKVTTAVALSALIVFFSYEFRVQTAILIAVYLILMFVLYRRHSSQRVFLIFFLALIGFAKRDLIEPIVDKINLETVHRYLELYTAVRAGHGSLTSAIWEVPWPWAAVSRIAAGLVFPYPGREFSVYNLLNLLSAVAHVLVFPFFIRGLWRLLTARATSQWQQSIAILSMTLVTFLPFALITGASRNVPYYYWLFCIIVVAGWSKKVRLGFSHDEPRNS